MSNIPSNIKKSHLVKDYFAKSKGYIWRIQKTDNYYYRKRKDSKSNWLAMPVQNLGYEEKIANCRLCGLTLKEIGQQLEDWQIPEK